MNFQLMMDRVKGILFDPRNEWSHIKAEQRSNKDLLLYYVLPFAAITALISFIVVLSNTYLGVGLALRFGILKLIKPFLAIVITAFVINELAETFDSTKNLNNAFKLVVYSYTPVLLAAVIASISWTLGWITFLGLYGIYILWIGLPLMMDTPDEKRLVYLVATIALVIIVQIIVGAIFGINRLGY